MFPWTASEPRPVAPSRTAGGPARSLSCRSSLARPLGAALFVLLALVPALALAEGVWAPLVRRLEADGFDRGRMEALFSRPEVRFDPQVMARKMNALLDVKLSVGQPKGEEPEIYVSYLNPLMILRCRAFLREQEAALRAARLRYGVQEEVLVALLAVETKLGRNMGGRGALSTLASMALANDYSLVEPYVERRELTPQLASWLRWRTAQKAAWAYRELKALLVYAKAAGQDPATIPGSVYGAIGIPQFMPSNAVRYGQDLDGDGRVNLFEAADAVLSAARFLQANGWRAGLTRERQLDVLYRYNHSRVYARTVLAVADAMRWADGWDSGPD